jgi:hypothetical protein
MANQDRYAGTTTNKAQVVQNLNAVFRLRANYDEFGYVNRFIGSFEVERQPI